MNLADEHSESDLEQALIQNIRQFLLEMGADFTFVGNQYRLFVNDKEYRIDLLLYHRKLQSLIAIDLKIGEFEPEHKGKMEFYLSVLNDTVKLPHENPAIGIIICKSKDRTIVEYSLQKATMPIGVATYKTTTELPAKHQTLCLLLKLSVKNSFTFFMKIQIDNSLPKYHTYKDSGVEWLGVIPGHWEIIKFKYLFSEINERSNNGDGDLLSFSQYTGVTLKKDKVDEGDMLTNAETLEGYKKVAFNDLE